MPASDLLSRSDAAHMLRRTGFGGSDSELAALTGMTREAAVDAAMGFRSSDSAPGGPDVGVPGWVLGESQWEAHSDAIAWWIQRMADLANESTVPTPVPPTSDPLPIYEKMALFWHEHFSCGQDKASDFPVLWDQIGLFRRTGLGNFDSLVRAVAVHPAMLVFLDNESNVAGGIQENFARELMELYTCGVGNFTEADVVAMARAWTGHNTVGWTGSRWDATYVYRSDEHDHGTEDAVRNLRELERRRGQRRRTRHCHRARLRGETAGDGTLYRPQTVPLLCPSGPERRRRQRTRWCLRCRGNGDRPARPSDPPS